MVTGSIRQTGCYNADTCTLREMVRFCYGFRRRVETNSGQLFSRGDITFVYPVSGLHTVDEDLREPNVFALKDDAVSGKPRECLLGSRSTDSDLIQSDLAGTRVHVETS